MHANKRQLVILQLATQAGEALADAAVRCVLEEGEIGEGKLNVNAIRRALLEVTGCLSLSRNADGLMCGFVAPTQPRLGGVVGSNGGRDGFRLPLPFRDHALNSGAEIYRRKPPELASRFGRV